MTNFTQKQIEEMLQEFLTDNFYVNISEVVRTTAINKRIKAAPKLAKQLLDLMVKLQAAEEKLKVAETALEKIASMRSDNPDHYEMVRDMQVIAEQALRPKYAVTSNAP